MAVLTLAIAALGLLIACLSFGWQIASWLLDGRRVKLVLKHGAMGRGGAALGNIKRDGRPLDLSKVRGEGFTDTDVLAVTVINIGRSPVVIERYSVVLEGAGLSFTPMGDAIGASLPHELQPGRSETWYAEMDSVRALVSSAAAIEVHGREISMTVELGTGQMKKTPTKLRVQ